MSDAPDWIEQLLGWKHATTKSRRRCEALVGEPVAPNLADMSSIPCMHLSSFVNETLGVPQSRIRNAASDDAAPESNGTALERATEADLESRLAQQVPDRIWLVSRTGSVADYAQFTHLNDLRLLLEETPVLRSTFARDYQVKTDVNV